MRGRKGLLVLFWISVAAAGAPLPRETRSPYPPISLDAASWLNNHNLGKAVTLAEGIYPRRSRYELAAAMFASVWREAGVEMPVECKQRLTNLPAASDYWQWG